MTMLVEDVSRAAAVAAEERQGFRRVLVEFDGTSEAWAALRKGIRVAVREHALLTVAGVVEDPPCWFAMTPAALPYTRESLRRDAERAVERQLAAARDEVPATVSVTTRLLHGKPVQSLAALAEEGGYDLILAGPRSACRLRRLLRAAT
jgi:nucleotide-binding universal stress UspA family protein